MRNDFDRFNYDEPKIAIIQHTTPEDFFTASFNVGEGERVLSFNELINDEAGNFDEEMKTYLRERFDDTVANGFGAFAIPPKKEIHLWFGRELKFEEAAHLIGHEVGHILEDILEDEHEEIADDVPDNEAEWMLYNQDEDRADMYGKAVIITNRILADLGFVSS